MGLLYGVLLFAAGMLLAIRLLAGLYSVIDLWYTIRTAWPVVLRRIVTWSGVTVVVLMLLNGGGRWAFVAGMGFHVLLYLAASLSIVWTGARDTRPTRIVE
ncbi:MAG: hypothetical protein GTO22_26760 [Gemmatimonadales bacterium]|nr:hypothetical protein [Gemmatimonadales bacterium]